MIGCLGRASFVAMLSCGLVSTPAGAQASSGDNQLQTASDSTTGDDSSFFNRRQTVIDARASQPNWSSPLVTTSPLLQNRVRFDADWMHSGNGTRTVLLDDTRGIALIVADTTEIQIAA